MGLALAAFYAGLLLNGGLEKAAAAGILVMGLVSWVRDAETRRALAAQTGLFLAFAALPLAAALSWLVNGMPDDGLKMLGKYARFLLVIPAYAGLWRWLRPQALWDGLLLAAAILALWNAAEALQLVDLCPAQECWSWRVSGAVHPIQYGGLSFALAAMLLAGMPVFFSRSRRLGLTAAAGATLVLFGALGSGTRIVYLALLPTLLCWGLLCGWRGAAIRRQAAGALIGVACAASLAWPMIHLRTEQALMDFAAYQRQDYVNTASIGDRLLYWQVSLEILVESPWTGVGPGQFRAAALERAVPGQFPGGVPSHPHSEY
ncbi:MAG: O-antigen ligase family protein, partial [Burkholderiales bacterium]